MSKKNKNPTLKEVSLIGEWLVFSDEEISIFQFYFFDYLKQNEEKLSKKNCYLLACLASETQYQMRIIHSRIRNEEKNLNIESNNNWILKIISYENLIQFVVDKITKEYEKMSFEKQYELSNKYYSYFTASDETKQKIKDDLALIFL